ncbi:unnamed protein product [Meganyctiphanes norvegica]|uniref:ILEI/PANDER domain-containing protein n=1 Tax=Meganyctiphanes norvegica TaxID=48144 RepID=A0AAV2R3A8_MEGNR
MVSDVGIHSLRQRTGIKMAVMSYIRRRVGKAAPIVKRVVLPVGALFLVMHMLTGTNDKDLLDQHLQENLIVPGEAIDPLLDKPQAHHYKHVKDVKEVKDKHESPTKYKPPKASSSSSSSKSETSKPKESSGYKDEDLKRAPSAWSMAKANITDSHKVRFKPHAITNDTVTLTLMSSADKIFMSINKKEIYRNLDDRGIHLVVVNQATGRVMAKRVFDTFSVGVEEEMVDFIDDIQDGRILIFAVRDEAATSLSWRGRNKLKELGGRWADKLAYRDMWALVTRKGALKLAETYSNVATADTGYEWGGPVFLRTDFDLEEKQAECGWPSNERNDARRMFCLRHEGYGSMCNCEISQWQDVFFKVDKRIHNEMMQNKLYKDIGIIILATDRPHYLYKTLKSLWEAPGINRDKIAVYVESHYREVLNLCKVFGVHVVVTNSPGNDTTTKIKNKLQRAFRDVVGAEFPADKVPKGNLPEDTLPPFTASHILVLEEDITVSIDIFKYFHSVAPVLEADKTIVGISAFNYFGYRDVASSLTSVYRTNQVNYVAVLLHADIIRNHLTKHWSTKNTTEWHNSLRKTIEEMKGAILYPEVPRAHHIGYTGAIIAGGIQHNLFRDHIVSLSLDYNIQPKDVHMLEAAAYDNNLEQTLKKAEPINFDFCNHDLLYGENPLIMFLSYDGEDKNAENWNNLFRCLRGWHVYPEAGWDGVWQVHYHGHLLNIVAVPLSKYSHLQPSGYKLFTAPPTTTTTTTTTSTTTTTTTTPQSTSASSSSSDSSSSSSSSSTTSKSSTSSTTASKD